MPIDSLLESWRRRTLFRENAAVWQETPARPARFADPPAGLDPALIALLQRRNIWPLYTHQVHAIAAALAGENVVVVTGTASGKTLAYNLPVLHALRQNPQATALYLFPTKALAQDQLAVLEEMTGELSGLPAVHLYDGDTPASRRSGIRRAGGIVLSNPDMLHTGILPHHTRWSRLFANLQVVVLDEVHSYRGVFGSHVANLMRRLRRICRLYGSEPQFICTSATIANPVEHVQRIIDAPVTLVGADEDGSPRGARHLILYNPPLVRPELNIRQSAHTVSTQIAVEFLREGAQTAVFARSRLTVEWLLTSLRERSATVGLQWEQVQGYRGGYLPNERRSIERGLREGTVRGVVATNALELGVDIGALNACVLVGYPGTIASVRQQAGRAGRRQESSVAVLVAGGNPLDQYIVHHPGFILEQSPERALINPDNLVILVNHLMCAAYELPFEPGETFGSFGPVDEVLNYLVETGYLYHDERSYHWVSEEYPAAAISLRSGSSETVVIQDIGGRIKPLVIGEVDLESAPFLVYQGAIYPHGGQTYLVETLDWEGRRADVRPVSVEYQTSASTNTTLEILQVYDSAPAGRAQKGHGRVLVTSGVSAYRKIKRSTGETLGWGEVDLPDQTYETTAYWLTLDPSLVKELESAGVLPAPLNYGPNWEQQKQQARRRDGGRCRGCGAQERPGHHHHVHHIRPFRTFGYIPGKNDFYLQANALDNLVTLCPSCHRTAEQQVRMRSALAGLSHVLRNLAPLFLMCDAQDIFVLAEEATITIYERAPAGVGFSEQLYESHDDLLAAAQEHIDACPCVDGCPACVGPPGEIGPETKPATLELLAALK